MKLNKIVAIVFCVFLLTLLGSLTTVTAVSVPNNVTFVSPLASGKVFGVYTLNVTNATKFDAIVNCSFYAKSALTANSSWVLINGSATNKTTLTNVVGTFSSTVLEDANDYIFNATCRNLSNALTDNIVTGVVVDNTVPVAPTLDPVTNTEITSVTTQTFTGTVTNSKTTSCTYVIGRGGTDTSSADTTSGTGTYSGSSCTFTKTFSGTIDNGNWYWHMTASDETNTTSAPEVLLQVAIAPTGGVDLSGIHIPAKSLTVVETLQQNQGTVGIILVAVIAVAVIIVVLVRRTQN